MRILKYIFLLFILVTIGLTVFIATQPANYQAKAEMVIPVNRVTLFNYLNNYRNWESWNFISEGDAQTKLSFPGNTVGKLGYMTFSGNKNGWIQTTDLVKNQEINFKISQNGEITLGSFTLRDTLGKTKIICKRTGSLTFSDKFDATFSGGSKALVNNQLLVSLEQLSKFLKAELGVYKTEVLPAVSLKPLFFVGKKIRCKQGDLNPELLRWIPFLQEFFVKNQLRKAGQPMAIYKSAPNAAVVELTIAIPTPEEVFLSPESDIFSGSFVPYRALPVMLTGDYSHRTAAIRKARTAMKEKFLTERGGIEILEIFQQNSFEQKRPSKWVTFLYMPIQGSVAQRPAAAAAAPTLTQEQLRAEEERQATEN
ncbi:hypothetical protein [Flavobacterium sp.]|uniref:hypothetical protein n=1 Tax=Flavobacterium sp. TaxID=239 RepID=UPI003B996BE9